MKKEEIIKCAIDNAKKYKNNLQDKNIMFIYENKSSKRLEFIETTYKAYNYLHLTGLDYKLNSNNTRYQKAIEFYKLATIGKLNIKNITMKNKDIVRLKMNALDTLMNIDKSAKMIGSYNNTIKDALYTEKVAGTVHYCLGFVKTSNNEYYLPNTTLSENILNITDIANRIVAILKKNNTDKQYNQITYLSKDIKIESLLKNNKILEKVNFKFFNSKLLSTKK